MKLQCAAAGDQQSLQGSAEAGGKCRTARLAGTQRWCNGWQMHSGQCHIACLSVSAKPHLGCSGCYALRAKRTPQSLPRHAQPRLQVFASIKYSERAFGCKTVRASFRVLLFEAQHCFDALINAQRVIAVVSHILQSPHIAPVPPCHSAAVARRHCRCCCLQLTPLLGWVRHVDGA